LEIKPAIDFVEEARRTVVAALNYVQRDIRKLEAGRSRHTGSTHERRTGLSPELLQENCSDPF